MNALGEAGLSLPEVDYLLELEELLHGDEFLEGLGSCREGGEVGNGLVEELAA